MVVVFLFLFLLFWGGEYVLFVVSVGLSRLACRCWFRHCRLLACRELVLEFYLRN